MSKKIWIGLIVILLITITLLVVKNENRNEDVIKIGAILPLTGDAAIYGKNAKEGIDIAKEEINKSGGILGKRIVVLYEDSQALPKMGINAYKKLKTVDRVSAIIGGVTSSVTLAFAPLAEKDEIVVFSPAATSPALSESGRFVFRNWVSDAYEAKVVANAAMTSLTISKMAILYINNEYGKGLIGEIKKVYCKKGGAIIVEEPFAQNESNFRTILAKVKTELNKGNCDAVYIIAYPDEIVRILNQAKELNVKTKFLATSAFKDDMILQNAADSAEGVIFLYPTATSVSSPQATNFQQKFKKKYQKEPGIVADTAFDALMMIAASIRDQGSFQGVNIQKGLEGFNKNNKYQGASGTYFFDENGDINKNMTMMTVVNGNFVRYEGN